MEIERAADFLRRRIGYEKFVHGILSKNMKGGSALSVGCGMGEIERMVQDSNGVKFQGVEVTKYCRTMIPVRQYDGKRLPFMDRSFDYVVFVYVLHHTTNITGLLEEARRVARKHVLILDHTYSDRISKFLLKVYDYGSNILYKMPIPFNFLKAYEWSVAFRDAGYKVEKVEVTSPLNVFFKLSGK